MTDLPSPATLAATALIDSDHPDVIALARVFGAEITDIDYEDEDPKE
jgi:hypothetical protein